MYLSPQYRRRAGTSGITGQLYETKLISLILFRLLHDVDVEEFYLASNMDNIGVFDDICLKLKLYGYDRQIIVLIQAKHKENDNSFLNYDLIRQSIDSFVKVKQKFLSNDTLFKGKFENTDCVFILYSNAKYFNSRMIENDIKPYRSAFSHKLNSLLGTGDADDKGYQFDCSNEDLEKACEIILEEELNRLAEHFTKFLKETYARNMMQDPYILLYHVWLARKVVDVSEESYDLNTSEKYRILKFPRSFFCSDEKNVVMLRKKIFERFKLPKKNNSISNLDELISSFLDNPSALTLSPLIGTHIIYKNGYLSFCSPRPMYQRIELKNINILPSTVHEAETIATINTLSSLQLKVPVTFGNIDLKLIDNEQKRLKRLNFLIDFIVDQCRQSVSNSPYEIVTLNGNIGDGYLALNGGIGSAIGNLLVYDEDTNFLKFSENNTSLPSNAKNLYDNLRSRIENLHSYRFDVSAVETFPKLVFDYKAEAIAMFRQCVIYEKQSNLNGIEARLIREVEQHHRITRTNLPIRGDTMVIIYHNEIQKWWMSPYTSNYFTKHNDIYQQALNHIIDTVAERQINAMQNDFDVNNMCFAYSFTELAIESISWLDHYSPRTIIVTKVLKLTTFKVIQCLRSKYVIVDIVYILNLPDKDFNALNSELRETEKKLIIVCNIIKPSRLLHEKLDKLAQVVENKNVIVITNKELLEIVQEYFCITEIRVDLGQSLSDLTLELWESILYKTKVIFQNETVHLYMFFFGLLRDVLAFIKEDVLNKIVCNETVTIGRSLDNSSYEKIKHLYVDRRVRKVSSEMDDEGRDYDLKTFNDIQDKAVVILAEAGMGKSTLLTHLSLKTKEIDKHLWIVRINLIDHTKKFKKWQNDETIIDTLEAMKFICQVVLDNDELTICLKENDGKVCLESCTSDKVSDNNELDIFELNMFLHYLNNFEKLIFLFDGYDEICPHYKEIGIDLIKIVKSYPRQQKLWVTSRRYSQYLPDLQEVGTFYVLESDRHPLHNK